MRFPFSPTALCAAVHAALFAFSGAAQAQGASAPQRLDEITVTTRADALPFSTLDSDELTRRNAIDMASIARYEALVSVPASASGGGSVWDGAGATGFNIRGIEGNRVALDLDGIALPDAAPKPDATNMNAFGIGRDYVDPATLREVRIASGTSGAGPGTPGLGGSVAFVTRAPQDYLDGGREHFASYALGYSGVASVRSHILTGAARSGAVQALALLAHRDGKAAGNRGTVAPNPDDWHSDALLAKLDWTLAPRQRLGLTVDGYRRGNARSYVNKTSALYPEGASQDSDTRRHRVSLEHRIERAGSLLFDSLATRLYVQDARVEDSTRARYVTGNQPYLRDIATGYFNRNRGAAADAALELGPDASLAYGVAYDRGAARRPWTEERLVLATGARQLTLKHRMADMETDKASAWVRGEYAFAVAGHKATLTPGLRAEYRKLTPTSVAGYLGAVPGAAAEVRTESDAWATPSLSMSVALAPAVSVYASATRGARLPTGAERTGSYDSFSYTGAGNGYAVLGNPALQKETSTAFETGVRGSPLKGLRLHAALFRTDYRNFIDYVAQAPDPVNYPTLSMGLYRPENNGSARTWGAEASLGAELAAWHTALAGWRLQAAAGAMHGSAVNKVTGKRGELASTLPRKASLTLAYDAPGEVFGLALAATATASKQPAADVIAGVSAARMRVPGAAVPDLTGYWRIGGHATLNVGIYNLGDRRYWDYASARTLAAGTNAATLADIERSTRPGRNVAATLTIQY